MKSKLRAYASRVYNITVWAKNGRVVRISKGRCKGTKSRWSYIIGSDGSSFVWTPKTKRVRKRIGRAKRKNKRRP